MNGFSSLRWVMSLYFWLVMPSRAACSGVKSILPSKMEPIMLDIVNVFILFVHIFSLGYLKLYFLSKRPSFTAGTSSEPLLRWLLSLLFTALVKDFLFWINWSYYGFFVVYCLFTFYVVELFWSFLFDNFDDYFNVTLFSDWLCFLSRASIFF